MKKIFFFWIAAGLITAGLQAQNTQKLVVHRISGDKVFFDLNDQPVTTFDDNTLVITTTQTQILFPMDEVGQYTYQGLAEGIDAAEADGIIIRHAEGQITINGLSNNALVEIYSLNGQRMIAKYAQESQTTVVDISAYPAGVFIMNAGNVSYKFVKL